MNSAEAAELTIGEVARRAGKRASSIRYYESIGLLPTPRRVGGQRRYATETLRTLAVIDVAQRALCLSTRSSSCSWPPPRRARR
jgi:DNA-binding transcriptional MerR regulator